MGANSSVQVAEAMKSEPSGMYGSKKAENGLIDGEYRESKKVRLDDLLQNYGPDQYHHVSDIDKMPSKVDILSGLPPDPITQLHRTATTRVGAKVEKVGNRYTRSKNNQYRGADGIVRDTRKTTKLPLPASSMQDVRHLSDLPETIPLIKRRSLLYAAAPGLSTRAPPAPSLNRVEELPESSLCIDNEHNQQISDKFPLRSLPPTNTDLTFGRYKLGTLRVVNGCPSPVPSQMSCELQDSSSSPYKHPTLPNSSLESFSGDLVQTEMDVVQLSIPHNSALSIRPERFRDDPQSDDCSFQSCSSRQTIEDLVSESSAPLASGPTNVTAQDSDETTYGDEERLQDYETLHPVDQQVQAFQEAVFLPEAPEADEPTPLSSPSKAVLTIRGPTPPIPNNGERLRNPPIYTRPSRDTRLGDRTYSLTSSSSSDISVSRSETMTVASSATSLHSILLDAQALKARMRLTQDGRRIPNGKESSRSSKHTSRQGAQTREFSVHRHKPKSLEEMIAISSGGNCSLPPSPSSWHSQATRSSLDSVAGQRALTASGVPLSYVPFEFPTPEAKASKIKYCKAPEHWSERQREAEPEFGMRIQKPRPIGDLKMVPRSALQLHSRHATESAIEIDRHSNLQGPRGPRPMGSNSDRSASASFLTADVKKAMAPPKLHPTDIVVEPSFIEHRPRKKVVVVLTPPDTPHYSKDMQAAKA